MQISIYQLIIKETNIKQGDINKTILDNQFYFRHKIE